MKACYPIHPEIFDRLYSDWSSIPQFQRTRGVLRMMANCVSRLYLSNDPSPLIMPATLPLDDPAFANEFTRLLSGQWDAVISEVDSDGSRTDEIDRSNRTFGDVGGAARRIARTIFLGSAPAGAVRGIDGRQVHLGVVQPGHGVSAYNDALSRMSGELYYLYSAGDRSFFNAEPNLNRLAADRAVALSDADVTHHVVERLEEERGKEAGRHLMSRRFRRRARHRLRATDHHLAGPDATHTLVGVRLGDRNRSETADWTGGCRTHPQEHVTVPGR